MVHGLEYQVDEPGRSRQGAGTHLVQHGLHMVGETRDAFETEHRPGALDGVKGAEELVDLLCAAALPERQGRLLNGGEQFLGLLQVGCNRIICHVPLPLPAALIRVRSGPLRRACPQTRVSCLAPPPFYRWNKALGTRPCRKPPRRTGRRLCPMPPPEVPAEQPGVPLSSRCSSSR